MPFLLPLAVLVAIASADVVEGTEGHADAATGRLGAVLTLGLLAAISLVPWPIHVRLRRRLERTGQHAWVARAQRLTSLQMTGTHAAMLLGVLVWGWSATAAAWTRHVPLVGTLLTIAPWLLAAGATLAQAYPLEAMLRGAGMVRGFDQGEADLGAIRVPSRGEWVWDGLRERILCVIAPGILLFAWWDVSEVAVAWWNGMKAAGEGVDPEAAAMWAKVAGMALMIVIGPAVMARVLPTTAVRSGSVYELARAVGRATGVRPPAIRLWRTTRPVANAAIMGAVPGTRTMLLTSRLVDRLDDAHLAAVMAHELAHVKHRHVPWIAGTIATGLLATDAVAAVAERAGVLTPGGLHVGAGIVVALGAMGLVARRFEWQADATGARTIEGVVAEPGGGPRVMAETLGMIGELNHVSLRRNDFLHGSLGVRIRRLARGDGSIHRICRWSKACVLLGAIASIGLVVWLSSG